MDKKKEAPKGPPPVTPKGKSRESVQRGMRSNSTGGDPYDRSKGHYSKHPKPKDDPFPDY